MQQQAVPATEFTHDDIEAMRAAQHGFPTLVPASLDAPASIGGLAALNRLGKPMYQGTVPGHVKAQRRAKNRAARHARRVHRR